MSGLNSIYEQHINRDAWGSLRQPTTSIPLFPCRTAAFTSNPHLIPRNQPKIRGKRVTALKRDRIFQSQCCLQRSLHRVMCADCRSSQSARFSREAHQGNGSCAVTNEHYILTWCIHEKSTVNGGMDRCSFFWGEKFKCVGAFLVLF